MDLPKMTDYCNWSTDAKLVSVGDLDLYFSYRTCVAFRWRGQLVCCENIWGKTTGRHLNQITHKVNRVPKAEFERLFGVMLGEYDRTAVAQS